jgi:hypothetical protein
MQNKLATITNGVDMARLTDTIEAVKASPELGRFQFRIQNRWIDCGQNRSEVQPFNAGGKQTKHNTRLTLLADEPDSLSGDRSRSKPRGALAACFGTFEVLA